MKQSKLIPLLGLGLTLFFNKPHLIYGNSGYGGGSGTETDPYLISTPKHLNQLQLDVNVNGVDTTGKYYRLTQNINLSNYDNDSDENNGNFKPIGNVSYQFNGIFDGNGKIISNLKILLPAQDYIGLFGYTGYSVTVQNVGLENMIIEGKNYVGGLVGYQYYGKINQGYVIGSIDGNNYVGGLGGHTDGRINDSYTIVNTSGNSYVGGFVGFQGNGRVEKVYSTGSVNGNSYVGGLLGYKNQGGTEDYRNTRCGYGGVGCVDNSYWDAESSGQNKAIGGTYGSIGAVGLVTSQMIGNNAKENMSILDFDTIWKTTDSYPKLKWQSEEITESTDTLKDVTINGTVQTMIADVVIPSVSPDLVINPNLSEGFVAPEFSILNESVSPIKLELKTFEQTTDTFNDVLPSKYESWIGLNKQQSQDIALGLVAKEGDGWQTLTTPTSYVAGHSNHEIGIIKPTSSVDFSFDVKHGTAFSEAKAVQYKMIFVFDLMS